MKEWKSIIHEIKRGKLYGLRKFNREFTSLWLIHSVFFLTPLHSSMNCKFCIYKVGHVWFHFGHVWFPTNEIIMQLIYVKSFLWIIIWPVCFLITQKWWQKTMIKTKNKSSWFIFSGCRSPIKLYPLILGKRLCCIAPSV